MPLFDRAVNVFLILRFRAGAENYLLFLSATATVVYL